MHELAICQSLLAQVETIALTHGRPPRTPGGIPEPARVETIQVSVGPLSGVEPKLLAQAFTIARAGTIAAEAELVLEVPPIRVHCNACGAESDATPTKLVCAGCGEWRTRVIAGDELVLTSVALTNSDADAPEGSLAEPAEREARESHV